MITRSACGSTTRRMVMAQPQAECAAHLPLAVRPTAWMPARTISVTKAAV